MKILVREFRVLAPVVILLALDLGCGRSPVAGSGQGQNAAPPSAQVAGARAASPESELAPGQATQDRIPQGQGGSSAVSDLQLPSGGQTGPAAQPATILVPRGARLLVRTSQSIGMKHSFPGEHFTGTLAEPVVVGNSVAIPAGSIARGEVLAARRRGLFKGRSLLALTLTGLEVHGAEYRIETSDLARTRKGKGRRSAALIGGGAGLGMLVGGVASGGVGLLVGGLAGGGAGTVASAFTGNRDIVIPAESVVRFRLENALTLTQTTQPGEAR